MEIRIQKSKRKSISLSHKDGVIYVKAPLWLSDDEIKSNIERMLPKLEKKIEKNKAWREEFERDGLWYLGKCYECKCIVCDFNTIGISDDYITIYHTPQKSAQRVYDDFIHHECLRLGEEYLDYFVPHFQGMTRPTLKVKKFKSRWGSYNYRTKELKLNECLVYTPLKNFEEVVCHELCHEYYHDHSKGFHDLLEKVCPGHRKLERELHHYGWLLK